MKGSALITGGASGIGKALALELARQGVALTVVDLDGSAARQVAQEISQGGGQAQAVQCDVTNDAEQQRAFQQHMQRFGSLDYALLNAGIAEQGDLLWSSDTNNWHKTLDVNLTAVLTGTRLAVRAMEQQETKGKPAHCVIMVTASAGGVYPMPLAPVYSVAKSGAVMVVQSLGERLMRSHGIRITALCPQFVDTPLVRGMKLSNGVAGAAEVMKEVGGRLLTTRQVTEAAMTLLTDMSKVGTVLLVMASGPVRSGASQVDAAMAAWASNNIPAVAQKLEVYRLSNHFREATRVVPMAVPSATALRPGQVLVRQLWAGVNASDINYTDGRYFGNRQVAAAKLPFDAGFEAVGMVAAVGGDVPGLAVGQPVAAMTYQGFAEYAAMDAKHALPLPRAAPEMVALLTSGLTASIGLEVAGRMRHGQVVLITAAAGGTGQFAVQLAKLAGNHVVATCSSAAKVAMLKALGADRVINYNEESVKEVLKREYPKGVDVVYESVGGDMFETCLNALAVGGRLVVIGMMSQYMAGWQPSHYKGVNEKLLMKSASITGFFLIQHTNLFRAHLKRLAGLLEAGQLRVEIDPRKFVGVPAVPDAVDWLHSGKSQGKVVVQLSEDLPPLGSQPASKL
ncbi:hypothetical protein N2152v2_005852 [Parachlorella kessleri]